MEDNFIVSMKFLDRELRQMDTEFNQLTLYFFETLKSYLIRARQLKGSSSDGCEEEFAHLKKHYMLTLNSLTLLHGRSQQKSMKLDKFDAETLDKLIEEIEIPIQFYKRLVLCPKGFLHAITPKMHCPCKNKDAVIKKHVAAHSAI